MAARYERGKAKRGDPFYEPPLHKAYYHPTLQKELSDEKRFTALSSDRMYHPPDASDVHFLKPTNTYRQVTGSSPGDTSSKFDETWPGSEKPSTLDDAFEEFDRRRSEVLDDSSPMKPLSGLVQKYLALSGDTKRPSHDLLSEIEKDVDSTSMTQTTTTTDKTAPTSTLSKYIERFRYGAPMSREERLRMKTGSDPSDFWWMNKGEGHPHSLSPKNSSTPKDDSSTSGSKVRSRLPGSKFKEKSSASTTTDSRPSTFKRSDIDLDSETRRLIEKTDQLLEKSESSLNSSDPVVSTVGLGSSSSSQSSSFLSARDPSHLPSHITTGKEAREESRPTHRPRKPGDDILYQWRAQRRLEAMRTKAAMRLGGQGQLPLAAVVSDETDARIAEIKRRVLRDSQRRDAGPHPSEQPPPTRDKPTDHLQDKPVGTDAFCQTSLDGEEEQGKKSSDFKPQHEPHSPFASPSLRRKMAAAMTEEDVQPHYHLSCDVIPCPHGHKHHMSQLTSQHMTPPSSPRKSQHRRKPRSYHSDTDTDESQRRQSRHGENGSGLYGDIEDDVPVKDLGPLVIDSCTDSEYENIKERHLADLESELSSRSSGGTHGAGQGQSQGHEKQTDKVSGDSSKKGKTVHSGNKSDPRTTLDRESKEEDGRKREKRVRDQKRDKEKGREKEPSKSSLDKSSSKGGDEESDGNMKSSSGTSTLSGHNQHSKTSSKNRSGPARTSKHSKDSENRERGEAKMTKQTGKIQDTTQLETHKKKQSTAGAFDKPKPKRSDRGQPEVKGQTKVRGQGQPCEELVGRRSYDSYTDMSIQDVSPLCHSSPIGKQRAVTPTIHKVVTERLFEPTSDEEESPAGDQQKPASEDAQDMTDESILSDGEEFADDDLLRDLRARRLLYIQRLEEVDRLLELNESHS